jgi:hypothetical protein
MTDTLDTVYVDYLDTAQGKSNVVASFNGENAVNDAFLFVVNAMLSGDPLAAHYSTRFPRGH